MWAQNQCRKAGMHRGVHAYMHEGMYAYGYKNICDSTLTEVDGDRQTDRQIDRQNRWMDG